ncbi:sulfurtransferase [uncultured Aquimarina sp.]|uniref:sulfurtransferase n=1 Tax=uncultured Aquimarina sp. TaxID=575652 RepID=UPI002612CA77|nr:sulfurtransferase [uncultured Aquimarina sp.]
MIYRNSILIILGIFILSCNKSKEKTQKKFTPKIEINAKRYYSSEYLIEAEELFSLLENENIKVIDFRKEQNYNKEHISGAINIWRTDIEDTSYPYKGMMAKRQQIEALFNRLGITNKDTLILYDDRGACDAARLWWILKNYDFESVKLLNGGLKAWKIAGGATNDEKVSVMPSNFKLSEDGSFKLWIGKDEINNILVSGKKDIILDTRNIEEFSGKRQKSGATKAGRIPNSILIDWAEAIDYNETQKFKSFDQLEQIYGSTGGSKNDVVITYCHSGVRSAHTTFVLTELLGYKNVKNYDGSWVEWSYFDELPFEQDSITTIKR